MEDIESLPAISYIHSSLPVAALGWVVGQGSPMEILKQPRLLLRQNSCSLPIDNGAPFTKDNINTTYWTWRSPLVPSWVSHSCILVTLVQEDSLEVLKKKHEHQLSHKTFDLQSPAYEICQSVEWHRTCGSSQPLSDRMQEPLHKRKPIPDTAWQSKNQKLDSPDS